MEENNTALPADYVYITTPDQRDRAIDALRRAPIIGVDTEGDSLYHYQERVSLIQIADRDAQYIFDPILLDTVLPLDALFGNRSILKIFHGADYDIVSLKRDFGFTIGPIFDTTLAARAIGLREFSLQHLLHRFFNVSISKVYQKSNWSARPLKPAQLEYAKDDTTYLVRLYELLRDQVQEKGRGDQLEEECRLMEEMTWKGRPFDPVDYLRIKGANALSEASQRALCALVILRDRLARERDLPPFKVMASDDFLTLAKALPREEADFVQLFPKEGAAIHRYRLPILAAIAEGLASPLPETQRETTRGERMSPTRQKLFERLKLWRNRQAEHEGVEPAMVIPSPVLKEMAMRRGPVTLAMLSSPPLLRSWQIKRYGEALLQEMALPAIKQSLGVADSVIPSPDLGAGGQQELFS